MKKKQAAKQILCNPKMSKSKWRTIALKKWGNKTTNPKGWK